MEVEAHLVQCLDVLRVGCLDHFPAVRVVFCRCDDASWWLPTPQAPAADQKGWLPVSLHVCVVRQLEHTSRLSADLN
eukprot:4238541-Pleurochrysis_carterae.AAC.2